MMFADDVADATRVVLALASSLVRSTARNSDVCHNGGTKPPLTTDPKPSKIWSGD
jgi:hypothetical protein